MNKKILVLLVLCALSLTSFAQRTTKYVLGIGSCVPIEGNDYKTYIKQIDVYQNYVYVMITRCPKRNLKRLNYWYSPNTKLIFDGQSIPLLGALSHDEKSYHSCTYDDGWGWNNAEMDKEYTFTLVFDGTVPDEINYVDLVDNNESYRGCSFWNMKLTEIVSTQEQVENQNSSSTDDTYTSKDYYMAYTITTLNLREGPGTDYDIITEIPKNGVVFFESDEVYKGFTKVLYVETGDEGYVSSKYLDGYTPVQVNDKGLLEATGKTSSKYSDITLYNDTDVNVNVKLGKTSYKLAPNTNKAISNISSGKYHIVLSSPGLNPYVGVEKIEGGCAYTYHIFIRTVIK